MPTLIPFTVYYRDESNERRAFCCYATDRTHAYSQAVELVPSIHSNPQCIESLVREDQPFDW